jgi:hypothetical protein
MEDLSKEKQIEEMARCICERDDGDICTLDSKSCDCKCTSGSIAELLYDRGYRKQSEGEWIERLDLQGFVCSNGCGEMLTEIEECETLPKFCPNCGTKMKNGTTIHEHVELLCKRLCRMKGGAE